MSLLLLRFNTVLRLLLAVGTGAYLLYFAAHAWLMLAHPFPIDYGEGPLLAQADLLLGGTSIWRLYADPEQYPFAIVNYPPLYLLLTAMVSPLTGSALAAGRLISLLAAGGCVAALWRLSAAPVVQPTNQEAQSRAGSLHVSALINSLLIALLFLTVPIVREWSALMRVDMLGVCFGLWGLVLINNLQSLLQRTRQNQLKISTTPSQFVYSFPAGFLLLACLFTKPSLIAAPAAGALWTGWLALRAGPTQRRAAWTAALTIWGTLGLGGGLIFLVLQSASAGWFFLHVVTANANRWDRDLALAFWEGQIRLRWPLAAAAALALLTKRSPPALLYTLFGALTATGVGKVGAYSNYFLELYAGLIWMAGYTGTANLHTINMDRLAPFSRPVGSLLLCLALLYYPPLWDAQRLRPAGLIEPSPPRLAAGRYGLWVDQQRESDVLAALVRVNTVLRREVQAAGPLIFTDLPGIAAQARVTSRLQVFEHRQLYDQGLVGQDILLHELANGRLPLAALDYLGNWLTPEVIELLQRRYAQDGSLGTVDLFRPVNPGSPVARDLHLETSNGALHLSAFRLADPLSEGYEPGELLTLVLEWQHDGSFSRSVAPSPDVTIALLDGEGRLMFETTRPLLYNVFPPAAWPTNQPVQHMQPIELPDELPAGAYTLAISLSEGNQTEPLDRQPFASIKVLPSGGRRFEETGYFVPAPLMAAWAELGGPERAGLPLTPAVPFAWGRLQCFERSCLELRGNEIQQRPLGEQLYLAETLRATGCSGVDNERPAPPPCPATSMAMDRFGAATLGEPISGEIARNGYIVQWTRYARIERDPLSGEPGLGRLGDDIQRLPPGAAYRWP